MKFICLVAPLALGLSVSAAHAQNRQPTPPENSVKASEIVATIEQRPGFHFIDSFEWDDDGYYEVEYYTTDRAKVEIKIDPVSGQPRQ